MFLKIVVQKEIYRIDELNKYLNSNSLYSGHLSCSNGAEYFFVDAFLSSKLLDNKNIFVSVNDAAYNEIFKKWKFPKKGDGIRFSRNIGINRKDLNLGKLWFLTKICRKTKNIFLTQGH